MVISPFGNSSYLGLGYGFGSTLCTSVLDQPNANNDKGEFYCKVRNYAMNFAFSEFLGRDATGIHVGYYLGGTLGGSSSEWYIINPNYLDKTKYWQSDFNILAELRLGLQIAYYLKEKDIIAGCRYYNCYSADAMRSSYGNADDAAVIGVFFANNTIGFDLNYATDNTPGIMVKSEMWDYLQCDLRYKIIDEETALYAGVRFEKSWLMDSRSFLNLAGHQSATVNSVLLTVGIALNKKHK